MTIRYAETEECQICQDLEKNIAQGYMDSDPQVIIDNMNALCEHVKESHTDA